MGRKAKRIRVMQILLSAFLFFIFSISIGWAQDIKENLYEALEFSENERAKILLMDKQMRIQRVINVPKGQKEIQLTLKDAENFYITFIENPSVDSKDSKAQIQALQKGVLNADFKESVRDEKEFSRYEAEFERDRFFGGFLGFAPYKFNYILPANVSINSEKGHTKRTEAKFQISIQKMLIEDIFLKNLDLYFSYTQQSFWQLYDSKNSRPFRESNYEPALYLSLEDEALFFDRINFGYMHQSNGGDLAKSRSWERLFIEGIYSYRDFALGLKAWYRIKEDATKDDNPDILDYLGYGELSLGYALNQHLFTLTLRNNLKIDGNRGAIMLDYSYPIYENFYLYVQYFSGYGESLVDYNRAVDRIGVGFLFAR